MKKILVVLISMISFSGFAQLSETQLNRLKYQVDSAGSMLHEILLREGKTKLQATFTVDTFKVESMMILKMKMDTTKAEQVLAINDAEIEYSFLLDKYYKLLLGRHDEQGQKSLALAQKKWVKYRDDEIAMTEKFYEEQKGGDPNTKEVAKAAEHLELTKERVVELYKHVLATPRKDD
ncbi:lysozyme inhibitor LprI family protein [Cytophaga aurantiaca]|uniref:lysozyme inhibitor LprI family protein n=1 Tax=Cytophaga aurantiaca TaxID=29530 RepID=UPI0012F83FE0|nr:lysozyme inhibitor LprI family protein [Cytophaga aurantiaca]